jgi:glycosyltransferase involved in cell wall biosynthesis
LFKQTGKSVLLADLPYAHETIGDYSNCIFFNPNSAEELAEKMKALIQGESVTTFSKAPEIDSPIANNWSELFIKILE